MFSRNPQKLEARAQGYEARGKTAKALKYRQKAAKFGGVGNQQILGQDQFLQQQQLMGQPMMGQQLGGQSLLGQQQLGGQSLLGQQQLGGQSLLGQQHLGGQSHLGQQLGGHQLPNMGQQQFQQPSMGQQQFQQPILGQQLGGMGHQLGGQQMMGQQQLGMGQQLGGQQMMMGGWAPNTRTPAMYESNAAKWEKRGNYNKAQKNRGKVWRLQNPQLAQMAPPQLYDNNREFLGYNVPVTPMPQQPLMQQTEVEHIVRPTIVEETMRPERIVEVQPIVHREIEAPQIKIVEKHLYETVPSNGPSTFTNAPIVQETVRPRIIEEVQPVVHREVPAPFVERVEQHVTEHIVNPTITTKQVLNERAAPVPFVAAGGPTMTQTTTTTSTQGSRLL